jgi:hypothetical protein
MHRTGVQAEWDMSSLKGQTSHVLPHLWNLDLKWWW